MQENIMRFIMGMLVSKYYVEEDVITPSSIYDDLALDSLAVLEIVAVVEKEFNVSIPMGMITSEMSIEESVSNIVKEAA